MRALSLAALCFLLVGCQFSPDMGDGPTCSNNSECLALGECTCIGGRCVPLEKGGVCQKDQECELPLISCSGVCTDTQTDSHHCGQCDSPCKQPPANVCMDDGRATTYPALGECDVGVCTYPADSTFCEYGCENGKCLPDPCANSDCPPGSICVEGSCVVDPCYQVYCNLGESCEDGLCLCGDTGAPCASGLRCCDGGCVDTNANALHCGQCGMKCELPPERFCRDGNAVILTLPATCSDAECIYSENIEICQGLGCSEGMCNDDPCLLIDCGDFYTCQNGECLCAATMSVCAEFHTCCSQGCVDLKRDHDNCGACGQECASDETCVEFTCDTLQTNEGVQCGGSLCVDGQYCCVDDAGTGLTCHANGTDVCLGTLEVYCDGPEECATGTVCCADLSERTLDCRAASQCTNGAAQVCHSNDTCPTGMSCRQESISEYGFGLCD